LLVEEALQNKHRLSKEKLEYFQALKKVDKVIITGGRFSGKSYEVGDWDVEATLQYDYKTLYTRFTNVSMSDSVIPEIKEKIDNNNLQPYFNFANNKFHSNCGNGLISFKGIKAGSGEQTANLKSLKGFNVMITDEAEEIPTYKTFEKVYFSIRSDTRQNISVLLLNPTTTDHWIYETFFRDRGVQGGFNGIKDDILYIHTSYLDVDPIYIPDNILAAYERMKLLSPSDYDLIVMGGWITDLEGALYKQNEVARFSLSEFNYDNVEAIFSFNDPADRGTDSLSMPVGCLVGDRIYITDWYFSTANAEVTIPEISFFQKKNKIETVAIEINGVGGGYAEKLQNVLGCNLIPVSQQTNKHSRIISNSGFVRLYMVFRDDYETGSMYDKAMRELFAYNKDDKENKKASKYNDDSPDSITGLWLLASDLHPNTWH
jgi:PBSX family phage terminase large subunit